jgi:hypothetical protein
VAHRGHQSLLADLAAIPIKPGQRYQHYKTKGIYCIDKLVMLEATDEVGVAYYSEQQPKIVWVRPYPDFIAQINEQTTRFSLLS